MLNIEDTHQHYRNALFHLGFRPFFSAAGLFAMLAMALWLGMTHSEWLPLAIPVTPVLWHSHEMVYGYAMAVIAGFLLTAVRNWTNVPTLHGPALAVLVALWLLARVLAFVPGSYSLSLMAAADLAFGLGLLLAVLLPIIKARHWKQQSFVMLFLLVLVAGNLLFYLSLLHLITLRPSFGIMFGLYFILAMILLMARRVLPFFIEKGVGYPVKIENPVVLDISIMVLYIAFALSKLELPTDDYVPWLSVSLVILNSIRLWLWHTPGIWRKPLLWSIYLAYGFIVLGFALSAITTYISTLALHAFAVGGVGLMTIGMMSRVALGHTGRNVFEPPRVLIPIFLFMLLAIIARVLLPLITMQYYTIWLLISQLGWIASFALFAWVYVPMLYQPRVDGRYG